MHEVYIDIYSKQFFLFSCLWRRSRPAVAVQHRGVAAKETPNQGADFELPRSSEALAMASAAHILFGFCVFLALSCYS